jgi:hypothetical protein
MPATCLLPRAETGFRRNQYGFVLGGPISAANRSFVDYQGTKCKPERRGRNCPSVASTAGDFQHRAIPVIDDRQTSAGYVVAFSARYDSQNPALIR